MSQLTPPPTPFSAHAPRNGHHGYAPPPPPPPSPYPAQPYLAAAAAAYPMPPQPRGNGAAVTSLVFGLLLFIPFLTGLVAVVTGFFGLKNARQPGRTGGGLATFGLLLGVANIALWGYATPKMLAVGKGAYNQVVAQNDAARGFIRDLSAGNADAAAARCHSTMPREAVDQAAQTVSGWGALQDVTVNSVNVQSSTSSGESWLVEGAAKYASGDRKFKVEFAKENGKWAIVEYNLKP